MIVLDTNILGTFTRIGSLALLFVLFHGEEIGITPAVYAELLAGVDDGHSFLRVALDLVEDGTLTLCALTTDEIIQRVKLPASLDNGEAESIALCQSRKAAFCTNDRRARNYCRTAGVEVFDLVDLLRAFWKLKVCSKRNVQRLLADIETQEGMVIKHRERIFAK